MSVALCVRVASFTCALPLTHVVETMRPLRVQCVCGAPDFVRGVALVRGAPAPVIDVAALLAGTHGRPLGRFVSLRLGGERTVMLGVDSVLGIRDIDDRLLLELPSLFGELQRGVIDRIGAYEQQLLIALHASRLVGDELWRTLAPQAGV